MAKSPTIYSPAAVARFAYLEHPDTEAPEGSSFKPDGKRKVTLVYDSLDDLAGMRKAVRAAAAEKWPNLDLDNDLAEPFKVYPDDHRSEEMRGKVSFTPKTGWESVKHYDAKKKDITGSVFAQAGDLIKVACSIYLYEKTEKVKENGKVKDVKVFGAALQLSAVQIIEKNAGGFDGFDEEDGFSSDETAAPAARTVKTSKSATAASVDEPEDF
jgi:hypothetical protein